MAETEHFEWRVGPHPMPWVAVVDTELITAKFGLRTYKVPIKDLKYVYTTVLTSALDVAEEALTAKVENVAERMNVDTNLRAMDHTLGEIVLCFEKGGKLKNVRLNAAQSDAQAAEFVDRVVSRRPDTDIRHMDKKEAYKLMATFDLYKVGSYALAAFILGIVAIGLFIAFVNS